MQNKYVFILSLTFVCALLLSLTSEGLRLKTEFNIELDIKKNILTVIGKQIDTLNDDEIINIYESNIFPALIDLKGNYIKNIPHDFLKQIENKVEKATNFLKLFSNKTRILVLCNLVNGRKTVNELALLINVKQSALSQHLKKMRVDQILSTQRSGKYIYYKIQDPSVKNIIQILYERFCK